MKFVVVEIQTNTDGVVGTLVYSYDTQFEAESKYHSILAAAAISTLPKHAAIMFDNDGFPMFHHSYVHTAPQSTD